jgi:hypothetical protein
MGRALMYATLVGLALFVLSATFLFEHGGGATQAVAQVSLHELRTSPKSFEGNTVTTEGVLDFAGERGVYQVSDNQSLFIVIRNYTGSEDLMGLRGRRVKVTGRFGLDKEHGAYIDADVVLPAE